MSYTLGQAAKATGMSKSTILRAIKSSKISATKDEASGDWKIDPAELHRVYPTVAAKDAARNGTDTRGELRVSWERERVLLEATIDDLRNRLSAADEERRTTLRQLTALLTDQRGKAPDVMVTPPPTSDHVPARSPLTVVQSLDEVKQMYPASVEKAPAPEKDTAPKRRGWVRVVSWITG